jgi:hypothetical protein
MQVTCIQANVHLQVVRSDQVPRTPRFLQKTRHDGLFLVLQLISIFNLTAI